MILDRAIHTIQGFEGQRDDDNSQSKFAGKGLCRCVQAFVIRPEKFLVRSGQKKTPVVGRCRVFLVSTGVRDASCDEADGLESVPLNRIVSRANADFEM